MMKIKSLMYPEGSKKRKSAKLLEIAEIERKLSMKNVMILIKSLHKRR
jgi:hypothetical protein